MNLSESLVTPMRRPLLLAQAIVVASFAPLLVYADRTPAWDWPYFNSLALVIRSCVWSYGRFPLQDPWVGGGIDLLANPQGWLFSPTIMLTLLQNPYDANVWSLIVFSCLGLWGASRFFLERGCRSSLSLGVGLFSACSELVELIVE